MEREREAEGRTERGRGREKAGGRDGQRRGGVGRKIVRE
jgi:hypothetical protein